jgi:glutaredoxin
MLKLLLLLLLLGFSSPQKVEKTLYYVPYCPYCKQVLDYLKTTQKRVSLKNVKEDPAAKEELKRIGGVLEVPCLIVGNEAFYSSEIIIEWLRQHDSELESTKH